jgi:hypothetical protein
MSSGKQAKKTWEVTRSAQVFVDSNISAHDDDDTKPWYGVPTLDFLPWWDGAGNGWPQVESGQLGAASPDPSPESAKAPRLRLEGAIPY